MPTPRPNNHRPWRMEEDAKRRERTPEVETGKDVRVSDHHGGKTEQSESFLPRIIVEPSRLVPRSDASHGRLVKEGRRGGERRKNDRVGGEEPAGHRRQSTNTWDISGAAPAIARQMRPRPRSRIGHITPPRLPMYGVHKRSTYSVVRAYRPPRSWP